MRNETRRAGRRVFVGSFCGEPQQLVSVLLERTATFHLFRPPLLREIPEMVGFAPLITTHTDQAGAVSAARKLMGNLFQPP
jgi:hypothetical protein